MIRTHPQLGSRKDDLQIVFSGRASQVKSRDLGKLLTNRDIVNPKLILAQQ